VPGAGGHALPQAQASPREQPPVQDQRSWVGGGYRRERRPCPGEPGPL